MKENRLRALFIKLKILEVADNYERLNQGKNILGDGQRRVERFNKFNPLTYLFLFIFYMVSPVIAITWSLFDTLINCVIEITKEFRRNPFKWH